MLVNRIAELRGKLITQEELAEELGLSRNTISKIENRKYAPSIDLVFKIRNALEKLTLDKTGVTLRLSIEQIFLWLADNNENRRNSKIEVDFPL
jgi:putative transcriptional regulator